MEFKSLKIFLQEWGQELTTKYKSALEARKYGIADSINFEVEINNTVYAVAIEIEDYWKWIEHGRGPGKFPPPDAITSWIRKKSIKPRDPQMSERTLGYLIGRKISREGIKPKNILRDTVETMTDFEQGVREAILKDLVNFKSELTFKKPI